jgi:6-phosphogluconolactonase
MGSVIELEFTVKPDVRVYPEINELSIRAAEAAVSTIHDAVRRHGKCSVALSGGSTPQTLYRLLASRFRDEIPWAQVQVFWTDERYVPISDRDSNYRMARENLLAHVPCPPTNVHPMPTHFTDPNAAARDYEATLTSCFGTDWPHFDLVLLGLGEEGHTASLFPNSPALAETAHSVVAVEAPADPPSRLTLTLPVINRAAHVYFLVTGSTKAHALHEILSGIATPDMYPGAGVRPSAGTVIWWVDHEAAVLRHEQRQKLFEQARQFGALRLHELVYEAELLLRSFPDLRDSFNEDELPISFILKRDGRRAQAKAVRRNAREKRSAE